MFNPDVFRMENTLAFTPGAILGHRIENELDPFDHYRVALPPVVHKPTSMLNAGQRPTKLLLKTGLRQNGSHIVKRKKTCSQDTRIIQSCLGSLDQHVIQPD